MDLPISRTFHGGVFKAFNGWILNFFQAVYPGWTARGISGNVITLLPIPAHSCGDQGLCRQVVGCRWAVRFRVGIPKRGVINVCRDCQN